MDQPALRGIVSGREIGNWEELDWSKVQALLLSLMLIALYAVAMYRMLSQPEGWIEAETAAFPEFSGALAALLGISLAGYEANQIPDHTTGGQ
jgi:hypothetical protein